MDTLLCTARVIPPGHQTVTDVAEQEAVTSIIFCVALSEYDQDLLEERGQVVSSVISRGSRCRLMSVWTRTG
jgi:hypothetical protein